MEKQKRYLIKTYGCQMNVHESEKLSGILEQMGYTLADTETDADLILFNTCAIRESAEQKIYSHIGELKKYKKQRKDMIIAVCGCMSQQQKAAENIMTKYPFVDIVFGTHNIAKLKELIEKRQQSKKRVLSIVETEDIKERDGMPKVRTSGYNAWVNITYGCNNFCTYCIVPYVRGREVSRPLSDIVGEVEGLLKEGYKKITLLGQNVNSYGNDLNDENQTFAKLLKAIDNLPYDFWLSFMTSHPKDISFEVLDTIASSKHIMHYLHLPVQSGSDNVLKAMNRRYTASDYLKKIDYAKNKISDIEFSSDIIVGFPGETEEDFNDTLKLISKVKYSQLFTFIYSKRRGTVAEKMENQIELKIKKERLARLIEKQNEIATLEAQKYIGKTLEVLVEGKLKNKNKLIATSKCGKNVQLEGSDELLGKFIKVRVESSKLTVLFAKEEK